MLIDMEVSPIVRQRTSLSGKHIADRRIVEQPRNCPVDVDRECFVSPPQLPSLPTRC